MEKNNQSVDIKSLSKEQRAALMAQLQQEEKEDRIARRETYEALRGEFMHEVKTNVLEMVNAVTGFRGWLEKEADAFTKVMKEYGQVKSDEQRSYTITDGDFRLEVKSNKVKGFDERADMAADRLIDYLKRFHQDYPGVRIKVTNSTSMGCVELLENRQVDLIVSNLPNSRLTAHTKVQMVKEFRDIFVANPDFFPLEGKALEIKKLMEYPLLTLSSKSTTSEYLHQFFASHRQNLIPEVELNSNDLLIDLARIGLGIACVPDYMLASLRGQESSLIEVSLQQQLPTSHLAVVYHESLPLSQAAQKFFDYFSSKSTKTTSF